MRESLGISLEAGHCQREDEPEEQALSLLTTLGR